MWIASSFRRLPLESQSSSVSSLVTLASPGVAADSNGLFHGLGDHASNSFSVDGQPITDQQSKVFSNQIPANSIQSIEVISGAPPAEFGGKTSLVIQVTTRSGQGVTRPTGSITSSYGAFGSATAGFDLGYGGQNWGNFVEMDGLNTGRFLDPPEFRVFHDKGNEVNLFDRVDRQFTAVDSIHLNLNYSRSWFQTPNAFDNLNVQNVVSGGATNNPVFGSVGDADQKSKIETFDISPTYTRVIGNHAVYNLGAYVRRDAYNYYASANPLADLGPSNLQTSSIGQYRTLTNAGLHTDFSYVRGIHTIKIGGNYAQTFLRENDSLGVVDATYNAPCVDNLTNNVAQPGFTQPGQCAAAGLASNDPAVNANGTYNPVLAAYDLTRGGSLYNYFGHTDVKELALYVEDQIKTGNWLFNAGIRGDLYNGLTSARQAEPRVGIGYNVKATGTVLRVSYARTLESPFNENLVLSSSGCSNAVLSPLLLCSPGVSGTLQPGFRNEFHAGFQQAAGKNFVFSGDYIWKYTHNAFDFSVLGNTPITFPIDWHNSKIPGFALRADVPNFHHLSAFVVMSSVAARFFPPQSAGAGATVGQSGYPFRIDHDERFNETTHVQYQVPGKGVFKPWISFNWRYDSGLVAGSVPCYGVTDPNSPCTDTSVTLPNGQPGVDLSGLTADEEFRLASPAMGSRLRQTRLCPRPALRLNTLRRWLRFLRLTPGTTTRTRNAFSHATSLTLRWEKTTSSKASAISGVCGSPASTWQTSTRSTTFLSTFSGTHYVTPRALSAEVGFHF